MLCIHKIFIIFFWNIDPGLDCQIQKIFSLRKHQRLNGMRFKVWINWIVKRIIPGTLLVVVLNGCGVVKTPYFKTRYYQNTISRLDDIKPEIPDSSDSLYAGFSKVSITPDLSNNLNKSHNDKKNRVAIAGFGQIKTKYATGIHDSVFVKSVALKEGQQILVIISADMLIMPPNIIDSVAAVLSRAGIQRKSLFFTATHTHSSIGSWGYGPLAKVIAGRENHGIEKYLTDQMVKSVQDAVSDLHPAKLGFDGFNGSAFIRNRLTGDPMHNYNDFNYMVVEQTGLRRAIMGSFSSHATTIGRKNTLISGDYPGYWQRKMESAGYDIAMFCAGSMGGQSPVGRGDEYENAKYIGESLADSLLVHQKELKPMRELSLSAISLKIYLPEYHMRLTKNINLTTGLSERLMPLPSNVYLQAIRINRLIWVFTPGDFSGELALTLKKILAGKGYQAMFTGYNGSYLGYIIPSKYFYLDNSESISMGWFGPTMGDYTMDLIERMADALISDDR